MQKSEASPKKIVHIIEASATGTLAMASLLANSQNMQEHEVYVIFSKRPETPEDIFNHFASAVKFIQIQMYTPRDKLLSLYKIRNALQNISPDFVFMHSSFSGFLGRVSSIFSLQKTKFFYIPHCISFMRKDVGALKRSLFVLFEWIAAAKKADYIACSRSEQKEIQSAIPFRKCHLVENALDFNAIPSIPQQSLMKRSNTVITVGQIRTQKGPVAFAEIARSVKLKDPAVEFLWIGDGEPEARNELETAGVRVVGWVPKSQVWQYLGESRLYLSTALWEGMPVSLIEASSAGVPVVASNCAGNVDVVKHEKTGWLYHTTEEAVGHILSSLRNPEHSQLVAKDAFNIAKSRFSVERYSREMEQLANS